MLDSSLIDRIVNGVLDQLAAGTVREVKQATPGKAAAVPSIELSPLVLNVKLVTADVLAQQVQGHAVVVLPARAIVTPAARDFIKERGLKVQQADKPASVSTSAAASDPPRVITAPLLIVVHHTDAVARLWEDLKSEWKRELVACPDDAAKLAIGELSRGGASQVVILAEQTYRAACLANRSEKVKAAAVDSVLDIKKSRQQIRVNTWCVDPHRKSWFELRNLFKSFAH